MCCLVWFDSVERVSSLMWDVLAFLWADCPDYFPRGLKECHYLALKWKHLLRSLIVFAREQLSVDVLWMPFESFVQCVKVWLALTSPQADWGLEAWFLWAMIQLCVCVCVLVLLHYGDLQMWGLDFHMVQNEICCNINHSFSGEDEYKVRFRFRWVGVKRPLSLQEINVFQSMCW